MLDRRVGRAIRSAIDLCNRRPVFAAGTFDIGVHNICAFVVSVTRNEMAVLPVTKRAAVVPALSTVATYVMSKGTGDVLGMLPRHSGMLEEERPKKNS